MVSAIYLSTNVLDFKLVMSIDSPGFWTSEKDGATQLCLVAGAIGNLSKQQIEALCSPVTKQVCVFVDDQASSLAKVFTGWLLDFKVVTEQSYLMFVISPISVDIAL